MTISSLNNGRLLVGITGLSECKSEEDNEPVFITCILLLPPAIHQQAVQANISQLPSTPQLILALNTVINQINFRTARSYRIILCILNPFLRELSFIKRNLILSCFPSQSDCCFLDSDWECFLQREKVVVKF